MFEKASRLKLRFESPQGGLTVEDLWDLPFTTTRSNQASLNDIAKAVSKKLKEKGEEDFVNQKSNADTVLQLQLDIAKHVIKTRQEENEAARVLADRREKKERIMELIAKKQDQELEGKSIEELTSIVAGL